MVSRSRITVQVSPKTKQNFMFSKAVSNEFDFCQISQLNFKYPAITIKVTKHYQLNQESNY